MQNDEILFPVMVLEYLVLRTPLRRTPPLLNFNSIGNGFVKKQGIVKECCCSTFPPSPCDDVKPLW